LGSAIIDQAKELYQEYKTRKKQASEAAKKERNGKKKR
jgi:hypothetical protein